MKPELTPRKASFPPLIEFSDYPPKDSTDCVGDPGDYGCCLWHAFSLDDYEFGILPPGVDDPPGTELYLPKGVNLVLGCWEGGYLKHGDLRFGQRKGFVWYKDLESVQVWCKAAEQWYQVARIKAEMEDEKKRVGRVRWGLWRLEEKTGGRRAVSRLTERMQRRAAEKAYQEVVKKWNLAVQDKAMVVLLKEKADK